MARISLVIALIILCVAGRELPAQTAAVGAIDTVLIRAIDLTGDGTQDTVSLHLAAQGLASPFSWELSIRSRGSVLCSYSGEDSRIDTLFHDERYVSGCKGYLDCKKKYYFHDVLEDLEVSYNLDWILDRTHSNSLFSIGKAYLESCCALCGAAADAVLESMEERLRNGQAVVIRIPTSPYTNERPMMFVPEVGRFVPIYAE